MKQRLADRLVELAKQRELNAMGVQIDPIADCTWVVWVFLNPRDRTPVELNDKTLISSPEMEWLLKEPRS